MSGYGGKMMARLIRRDQKCERKIKMMQEYEVLQKVMQTGEVYFKLNKDHSWEYEEKATGFKIQYDPKIGIIMEDTGGNSQGWSKKVEALHKVAERLSECKEFD